MINHCGDRRAFLKTRQSRYYIAPVVPNPVRIVKAADPVKLAAYLAEKAKWQAKSTRKRVNRFY